MTFREKSAWAMGLLMIFTGVFYLRIAGSVPPDAAPMAQVGALVPYVLAVIVGSIAVQIALAVWTPRHANAPADERERPLLDKAGHWSGVVLASSMIIGLVQYVMGGEAGLLFQWVVGSLIVAQVSEYAFQIVLFRRGA